MVKYSESWLGEVKVKDCKVSVFIFNRSFGEFWCLFLKKGSYVEYLGWKGF